MLKKKIYLRNYKYKKIIGNLLLFLILLITLSCSSNQKENSVQRYVITSPEVAEIVALLDGKEHIVGVTKECNYPSFLNEIPIVGTFGKINFEKVIELNPTYVLTAGLEQEKLTSELLKLGIKTESFYSHSIDEMYESILKIGEIIERKERANFVVDSLKIEILEITKLSVDKKRPNIYIEIYGDPIMSVSDSSFVGSVIEIMGANNVFDKLPRDYSRISSEKVIEAQPDIMIITYPGMTKKQIQERKGWDDIPAVKNGKIYGVDDLNPDYLLRTTPRIILGMKQLLDICNE